MWMTRVNWPYQPTRTRSWDAESISHCEGHHLVTIVAIVQVFLLSHTHAMAITHKHIPQGIGIDLELQVGLGWKVNGCIGDFQVIVFQVGARKKRGLNATSGKGWLCHFFSCVDMHLSAISFQLVYAHLCTSLYPRWSTVSKCSQGSFACINALFLCTYTHQSINKASKICTFSIEFADRWMPIYALSLSTWSFQCIFRSRVLWIAISQGFLGQNSRIGWKTIICTVILQCKCSTFISKWGFDVTESLSTENEHNFLYKQFNSAVICLSNELGFHFL